MVMATRRRVTVALDWAETPVAEIDEFLIVRSQMRDVAVEPDARKLIPLSDLVFAMVR
jgi:hypothetical protein